MPVPRPRCQVCNEKIDHHPSRGQHPKYCPDNLICTALGRQEPKCGRCKKPFEPEHFSQRYHEECALGCKVCGKPLRARMQSGSEGGGHMQPIYCSEECQEYAWDGDELPTCRKCGKKVELPKPPQSYRNPPKMHRECRPKRDAVLSAEAIEEARRAAAKAEVERQRKLKAQKTRVPVDPAKAIRTKPKSKYPNPFEDDDDPFKEDETEATP